jgi:hypothetical protein
MPTNLPRTDYRREFCRLPPLPRAVPKYGYRFLAAWSSAPSTSIARTGPVWHSR